MLKFINHLLEFTVVDFLAIVLSCIFINFFIDPLTIYHVVGTLIGTRITKTITYFSI